MTKNFNQALDAIHVDARNGWSTGERWGTGVDSIHLMLPDDGGTLIVWRRLSRRRTLRVECHWVEGPGGGWWKADFSANQIFYIKFSRIQRFWVW